MAKRRLLATMVFEFDAFDFVDAAKHQQRLVELFKGLSAEYPEGRFTLTERRARGVRPPQNFEQSGFRSGRIREYED